MASTVFPAAGGGVTQKVQEFTSTGTFVTPSNCSSVQVFLVGGGGGGGYINSNGGDAGGGGGGGGEVISRTISVTPGTSYTVTIGGGGSGATSYVSGGVGTSTTFGSLVTAFPGGGGGSFNVQSGEGIFPSGKGGGGASYGSSQPGGAGGGAGGPAFAYGTNQANTGAVPVSVSWGNAQTATGNRGPGSGSVIAATTGTLGSVAGYGIDGYGNGGGGGFTVRPAVPSQGYPSSLTSGTGRPGYFNVGVGLTAAVAPSANTGDGGHGAMTNNSGSSTASGSNGASGFARIIFWS